MPRIELTTHIHAPAERVFDLSRSIDLHRASTAGSGETALAGVTSGLIGPGEQVTWRARHFGVWQRLTSRITRYEPHRYFRDSMVRGAFRRFDHDHYFRPADGGTMMTDVFDFDAPGGIIGAAANCLFLTRYLERFLTARNRHIKAVAESEKWRDYLPAPP